MLSDITKIGRADLVKKIQRHLIWITNRNPTLEELVLKKGKVYENRFLVWDGESIHIDFFIKPLKENGCCLKEEDYYSGYWKSGEVKAWLPLPEPPGAL
jgi:hypothetical protein